MGKVAKGVAIAVAFVGLAVATGGLSVVAAGTAGAATVAGVTFTTTLLGGMLISMGAAALLSGVSQQFFGVKVPKTQLSRLNVSLDPSTPRKIVLGTTAMPLDLRYHESSGPDQEYVDYIIAVAAHKVKSITEIWFEEKLAWTFSGGVTGTYSGYLTVAVRTEGTADNYIPINGGVIWGLNCRLTGCAYVHLRMKRTGNDKAAESPVVNGLPSRVTIVGDGAFLYDPRKDSTVPGGSGSHRATDQSTWGAYTNADDTDNPALQLLWWMLGWKINGKLSVGCGVPYNRIDMQSFITAANICDENVTLSIGGTQKRYRSSGTASDSDDRSEIINNLLISMNATLRDNGGKLTVTAMKNDLADYVLTFNENDMYGQFDWQQTRGLTENYNIVRGRYVDPSPNSLYQMVDYPEIGFATSDGIERVMSLDLSYVEDGRRAQRIAKQMLQRNQYRGMFSTTFSAKALGCQVGDVVRISFETLGWLNKPFRVVSQEIRFDGQVPMALVEENAAIYAWDANDTAPITPTAPTIYNPLNSPFILGINDAGTTADWSGIIDDNGNKPDDNATRNVNRGEWSGASVSYIVGDFVQRNGSSYSAIVAHVSTALNGPPGANWLLLASQGVDGAPATSGYLTKEVVQLFSYANGAVLSYAPASGSFKVTSGNTDVSTSFSLSTISNPQALTVSYVGQTYSVTGGFDANEDTATLGIRATGSGAYAGVTIDKLLSLSKAKGGYEIVLALPTTDLFEGRIVFLTTDDKLYRYVTTPTAGWTTAVPAVDITGQIAGTQITDGAISTAKLAANSVTANEIATNAITADKILAGAITAAKVSTNEIIAFAANIKDGVIETAKIGDAQISTAKIGDLQVSTLKIGNNAVTIPISAYTAGSIAINQSATVWTTVQSATIISAGSPITLSASSYSGFYPSSGNTVFGTAEVRIRRNSTVIYQAVYNVTTTTIIAGESYIHVVNGPDTFNISDTPGAGTFTYYLEFIITGPFWSANVSNRSLLLLETKK